MKKHSGIIIALLIAVILAETLYFNYRPGYPAEDAAGHAGDAPLNQQAVQQPENIQQDTKKNSSLSAQRAPELDKIVRSDYLKLDVPLILQNPDLPNGCEITSATMALKYWGFNADKCVMADRFLPKGEPYYEVDPEELYMGDPRSDMGWYCMTGPIVEAVNKYFAANYIKDMEAVDISGATAEELKELVANGYPVIFWATVDFKPVAHRYEFTFPDGSFPFTGMHCMVLSGYDGDMLFINDPLGICSKTNSECFTAAYDGIGRRAVLIHEK